MNYSNDIVINPLTQRPIKIGGRIYMKLVHDGILCKDDLLKNELATYDDESDARDKIIEHNNVLGDNLHAVRGRGKHQNKIVVRRKPISTKETTKTPKYMVKEEESESELSEIDFDNLEQPEVNSDSDSD